MEIGILSDTHGHVDDRMLAHLAGCDELWHAGDIGHGAVEDQLRKIAPLRAVFGNIDNHEARQRWPEFASFVAGGCRVLMVHIAGSFSRYNAGTLAALQKARPQLLICGHSHILKVAFNQQHQVLHINPGAAGKLGFHQVRTMVRLSIEQGKPGNLRIIELGPRSTQAVGGTH